MFITACALGLSAMSVLGHAQTDKSRLTQQTNTMTQRSATPHSSGQAADTAAIRPFHVRIPEEQLVDLRRRIAATQWPEKETVADQSQGVPLATMQALARYWATAYDWRTCEAKLNALPHFITAIDGLDIHFMHVRSNHPKALPLIVTTAGPARSSSS